MAPPSRPKVDNTQKEEAFAKRTTFHVNLEWDAGDSLTDGKYVQCQMYVESLEPLKETQKWPLILIHGDYHSSQIWLTKPDKQPGWASFFVGSGYRVYIVDLPPTGRSNFLRKSHFDLSSVRRVPAGWIEKEVTAPKSCHNDHDPRWLTAKNHDKWPGTGLRGDAIFDNYCASLASLFFSAEERQTLAQNALKSLLQITGKSVLIGEGTGATMAWLAADLAPDLVAGVVAIEPPGPPFCKSSVSGGRYDTYTGYDPTRLKYGLASIPLTYDPPARAPPDFWEDEPDAPCLDLAVYEYVNTGQRMVLQHSRVTPDGFSFIRDITKLGLRPGPVRKLINLQKMRHVLFTGEASSHSAFDGATLHFMQQAGLTADCGFLEKYKIFGNGHLMFLETNSDDIAALVVRWIQNRMEGAKQSTAKSKSDVVVPRSAAGTASIRDIDLEEYPDKHPPNVAETTLAGPFPLPAKLCEVIDLTANSSPNIMLDSGTINSRRNEGAPLQYPSATALPPIASPSAPENTRVSAPIVQEISEPAAVSENRVSQPGRLAPFASMTCDPDSLPMQPPPGQQRKVNFEETPWRRNAGERKRRHSTQRAPPKRPRYHDSAPWSSSAHPVNSPFPVNGCNGLRTYRQQWANHSPRGSQPNMYAQSGYSCMSGQPSEQFEAQAPRRMPDVPEFPFDIPPPITGRDQDTPTLSNDSHSLHSMPEDLFWGYLQ